jgi:vancomycin permeability regulator SanA
VVDTGLIVRTIGDIIVIDRDNNSKPLFDALLQAGVPREQIVLAYAGESIPHAA